MTIQFDGHSNLIYSLYKHLAFYISINGEKQQHSLYFAFTYTY